MIHAKWMSGLLLAAIAMCAAGAQEMPGAPQPDKVVRDPEFGVVARHLGLERQVEMLQWQAQGPGYRRVWSAHLIDSAAYAPGHANPSTMPLRGRRWLARTVTIDGKPVDPGVIQALGQWRDFRPGFSALPGNLAATFQPEGMGLGSADNPLAPKIGDLRIRWRDLVLPPLEGAITLRDGRWQLVPNRPPPGAQIDAVPALAEARSHASAWWLAGALGVLIVVLAARGRRRR